MEKVGLFNNDAPEAMYFRLAFHTDNCDSVTMLHRCIFFYESLPILDILDAGRKFRGLSKYKQAVEIVTVALSNKNIFRGESISAYFPGNDSIY